jgi:hypothetical protein
LTGLGQTVVDVSRTLPGAPAPLSRLGSPALPGRAGATTMAAIAAARAQVLDRFIIFFSSF